MIKNVFQKAEIRKLNKRGDEIAAKVMSSLTGANWLCNLGWHKQVYTHDATVGYYYWASFCQRCGHYDNKYSHSVFSVPPFN